MYMYVFCKYADMHVSVHVCVNACMLIYVHVQCICTYSMHKCKYIYIIMSVNVDALGIHNCYVCLYKYTDNRDSLKEYLILLLCCLSVTK